MKDGTPVQQVFQMRDLEGHLNEATVFANADLFKHEHPVVRTRRPPSSSLPATTAVNARKATALRRSAPAFLKIGNLPFAFALLAASSRYRRPLIALVMCSGNMADSAAIGTTGTIGHIRLTTPRPYASHRFLLRQRDPAAGTAATAHSVWRLCESARAGRS